MKKISNIDISTIAILSASACIGRLALSAIPSVELFIPIIILSSAYFQGYYGILISIITVLTSNIFLGQGPWTLWQIVCCVLVSVFAHLIFFKKKYKITSLNLCLASLLLIFLVYSPIINLLSIIFYFPSVNKELITTYFLSSLPFDVLHSISCADFVFMLNKPFKLIKDKFTNPTK